MVEMKRKDESSGAFVNACDICADEDAWSFTIAGTTARVRAPSLHGTISGRPWAVTLPLSTASYKHHGIASISETAPAETESSADVPRHQYLVLGGSLMSRSDCPDMDWELDLRQHMHGMLMRVKIVPKTNSQWVKLEHITLAAVELNAALPGTTPATPTYRRGVYAMLTATALAAVTAIQTTTLAIFAAIAFTGLWWKIRGSQKESIVTMLINGWQSFSFSGSLGNADEQPRTPLPMFSSAFHSGVTKPRTSGKGGNLLVSDLYSILMHSKTGEAGVLMGFVTGRYSTGGVILANSIKPCASLIAEQSVALTGPAGYVAESVQAQCPHTCHHVLDHAGHLVSNPIHTAIHAALNCIKHACCH